VRDPFDFQKTADLTRESIERAFDGLGIHRSLLGIAPEDPVAKQHRDAHAAAMDALATMACPEDLVDLGRRHGVPVLTDVVWKNGFETGWRLAVAYLIREREDRRN